MSSAMHSRSMSSGSAHSSLMPSPGMIPTPMRTPSFEKTTGLEPCSANSNFFLFAQGASIMCLQHDLLVVERRFEAHTVDVTIIAVDNASEDGTARVVSVDASKQAIVWDTNTGEEISQFASFEEIRVAAWMKNGNLAFGDTMGNIILFDPSRSESISARTIFDPLCSIAPAADCKTFALGYANGSVLVVALSPSFTILHTLTTTSLSPSPIVSLAWHTSSWRQKSDMLATQTRDGDLRVWSVPKTLDTDDTARVVRVLKKSDSNKKGNNWMGWSKGGRIVQYSEGETTIWDVRASKVSWERVETLDNISGVTIYGPKGILFTVGKDHTVQQYSLYPPALMVNVQHLPTVPPPSPPVSIEERKEDPIERYDTIMRFLPKDDEEDYLTATMSPLGRIAHELEQLERLEHEAGLGITNGPSPRAASVSSRSSGTPSIGSLKGHQQNTSSSSRSITRTSGEHSDFVLPPTVPTGRKGSFGGGQPSPNRRPHPLQQEFHPSPEEEKAKSPIVDKDLFFNLRQRISSVTYESPRIGSPNGNMTEDDHRKEMLFCIFGWKGDIDGLINDELDSVDARSLNAVILRMWLSDLDQNALAVLLGADFMVPGDWMFLALSAMGGLKSWNHVVRAFVMRLLQRGELHTAVLCLLALGDQNDAVEVYVSHKRYMEAVLLASLLWKKDWKRQSQLVRKWGEHAAENAEAALAARCFACAGTQPPIERPAMPSRSHTRSRSDNEGLQKFVRGLSISSPSNPRETLRMTPKNSPLKLITTFPAASEKATETISISATTSPVDGKISSTVNRFFGWGDRANNRTPVSASTPIATSALSPVDPYWRRDHGFPKPTPGTAKLAPVTEQSPDTPKQPNIERLPPPTQAEKGMKISSPLEAKNPNAFEILGNTTFGEQASRGATPVISRRPSPPVEKPPTPPARTPITSPLPAPTLDAFKKEGSKNGSAARKPAGLQIQSPPQWPPMDDVIRHGTPPITGKGHSRTGSRTTPPVPPGRPKLRSKDTGDLDSFLNTMQLNNKRLDSQRAEAPGARRRTESPDPNDRNYALNANTEGRGRKASRPKIPLMRSPSSPLPMSPQAKLYREEIEEPNALEDDFEDERYYATPPAPAPPLHAVSIPAQESFGPRGRSNRRDLKASAMRSPSSPVPMSSQAHFYQESEEIDNFDDESYYTSHRAPSRGRGRSNTRIPGASAMRSPSSPLPMSPQAKLYQEMANDVDYHNDEDERYEQRSRRLQRNDSMARGRQHSGSRDVRRSRSERGLRQWSDELERAGSRERPSMPHLPQRKMSLRGLPATPRAWKNGFDGASRSNSPVPGSSIRGVSPAMAPAPMPQHSVTTTPIMSPAMTPRTGGTMSPAPRSGGSLGSTRGRSSSRTQEIKASIGLPATPMVMHMPNYGAGKYDPNDASVRDFLPEVPPIPSHSRSNSHARKGSNGSPMPGGGKPIIRKFTPQLPPDSPPPLPMDLPMHPAVQMNLDPSTPGSLSRKNTLIRGRMGRKNKKSDEMMAGIDGNLMNGEQSIVVGIETTMPWEGVAPYETQYYQPPEMLQRRRHMRGGSLEDGKQVITIGMEEAAAIGRANQF